jgi:hypothetical protein
MQPTKKETLLITLSRRQIRTIRTTIGQALGSTSRRSQMPVGFQSSPDGIEVTANDGTVAIRQIIPDNTPFEPFALPLAVLAECEGRGDEVVHFRRVDEYIEVEWRDNGIPQVTRHGGVNLPTMPAAIRSMTLVDGSLLAALSDAVETTDRESTRYALNHIQLRGNGQIVATDGRQAYVHGGFEFPWNDEVIVPASQALTRKELADAAEVAIGKSAEWVMLRADAVCLWLKVNKEARFPRVDDHIPSTDTASTTLRLDENDAQFLVKAMPRLPGAKESNSPLTLDLNGQVAVRVQSNERSTELVLSCSHREGEQIRLNTNRNLLARAARLGFRDIYFHGAESPAVCHDGRRKYFWALLGKDGVVQPSDTTQRITSVDHSVSHQQVHRKEQTSNMPSEPTKIRDTAVRKSDAEPAASPSPLAAAEALRDSLKQSLDCTRDLIASLRKRKKQSRLVESTLASLRQLQGVA